MTDENKFTTMRITIDDLDWLRQRAEANHRSPVQEISAIRELLISFEQGTIRLPVVRFTGKGDEITRAFQNGSLED